MLCIYLSIFCVNVIPVENGSEPGTCSCLCAALSQYYSTAFSIFYVSIISRMCIEWFISERVCLLRYFVSFFIEATELPPKKRRSITWGIFHTLVCFCVFRWPDSQIETLCCERRIKAWTGLKVNLSMCELTLSLVSSDWSDQDRHGTLVRTPSLGHGSVC